jgi:hypothetical protein
MDTVQHSKAQPEPQALAGWCATTTSLGAMPLAPAFWTAAALCRFGRAKSAGGPAHSKTWRPFGAAAWPRRGRTRIAVGETHGTRSGELCDPAGVEQIGQRQPWVGTHGYSRPVPAGLRPFVAQSCTLPYRRFAIGRASHCTKPLDNLHASQNSILRYGRLQVCATGQRSHALAHRAIRSSAFGFVSDFGFRTSDFTS